MVILQMSYSGGPLEAENPQKTSGQRAIATSLANSQKTA